MSKLQRYSSYKESGVEWIGEIPEHWELKRLCSKFIERKQKVSDKDFEPLSVTKYGVVPQLDSAAKSNDGDNRKLVKKGDFVINSRSDRKGSSGISPLDGSVSLINITLQPLNVEPSFCNYLLRSNGFVEEYYRNGHGIVADLWTTRYWDMKSIMLAIPSKSEQTAIASFLDTKTAQIDQAISQKEKMIELLKERRQIVINEVVTKGLDPNVPMKESGVEWIGKIPEHWEVSRLRYLGKTQNGISKGGEYFGTGFPFVSYGDVYKDIKLPTIVNGLAESSIDDRKQYSVLEGDVLFTRTSETVEEIGFSSTCLETIENSTFAGFLIRFRPQKNILYKEFSKYYFSSKTHRAFFIKEMNLVIRASLSQDLLKRMPVLLPPLSEQEEIGNYLNNAMQKIDHAVTLQQRYISTLKEYKATLIDSVVTGKVRVA